MDQYNVKPELQVTPNPTIFIQTIPKSRHQRGKACLEILLATQSHKVLAEAFSFVSNTISFTQSWYKVPVKNFISDRPRRFVASHGLFCCKFGIAVKWERVVSISLNSRVVR